MGMKMRKMAMKKSVIAKGKRGKSSVWRGTKVKTSSGLKKSDLHKSKSGKIVSKKSTAAGKKAFAKNGLGKWLAAVKSARKQHGIKGFKAIKKGSAFYKTALALYKKK